jgi:tryptophan 2,3-dioxygenase
MDRDLINDALLEQLDKLSKKYEAMGQDLSSYLDGLLYSDYLTYWDYIHLDTLLSLQNPRTDIPDEKIFILYHQITELYFKLILNEADQLIFSAQPTASEFLMRVKRMNRYINHLVDSFDIMIDGMEPGQFLKFRMSLLPASGFQSGQYRLIEIACTDFHLLTRHEDREGRSNRSMAELYEDLYWKSGATELATGKKTLTLRQFETKYRDTFIRRAEEIKHTNLRQLYLTHFKGNQEIELALRELDHLTNVSWPLVHMRSASRYLQRDPEVIKATGGTNWQKYLPPKLQLISFYPELWNDQERETWGTKLKL